MERFVKGEVVVIPFPFSNLSASKRRPALVLADLKGDDLILCQITSKTISDSYSVPFDNSDFLRGSLNKPGHIRPNRLFTAEKSIILKKAGAVQPEILEQVIDKLIAIIKT